MTAYLIAQVRIHDAEIYKQYTARSPAILATYGGRVLARGGATEILEGDPVERRVAIVEFSSIEAARAFYYSPEYQQARRIRVPISDGQFLIVEGIE